MFTHNGSRKNTYLDGFLGIGQDKQLFFTNAFDEPTYLTIRVDFFPVSSNIEYSTYIENKADDIANFECMPHPLLEMDPSRGYNTLTYLHNHGDEYRASLLEEFRKGLHDLSKECPYYITNVEGLAEIMNVNPARGSRTKQDSYLKLTCNEGLDMRITALLDMYKKIAWDDTFQRWMLPDMMRYFMMDITITEFRIFKKFDRQSGIFSNSESEDLIDLIAPSIKFECYMCEFMFDEMYNHLSSFSVSDPRANSAKPIIKIKIGNVKQNNKYTLFKGNENLLISDIINIEYYKKKDKAPQDILNFNLYNRPIYSTKVPDINRTLDSSNFITNKNAVSELKRTRNASSLSTLNTITNVVKNVKNNLSINKTIKNALTSIVAEADSVADNWLNDMMFKPLGKTNLSFNTILNAVTSNDIRTMYNTFKIKAEAIKELYPELSTAEHIGSGDIAVDAFKSLLAASTMIEPKTEIESGIKEISKALLEYDSKEHVKKIDDFIDLIYDATDALDAFGDKKKIINKNLSDIYSSVTETPKTIKKIIL